MVLRLCGKNHFIELDFNRKYLFDTKTTKEDNKKRGGLKIILNHRFIITTAIQSAIRAYSEHGRQPTRKVNYHVFING